MLGRIAELTYALNLGAVSREYAYSSIKIYTNESEEVLGALRKWHLDSIDAHGVNIQKNTIRRNGLDKVLFAIPAVFKEELKYKGIGDREDDVDGGVTYALDGKDEFDTNYLVIKKPQKEFWLDFSKYTGMHIGLPYNIPFKVRPKWSLHEP